MFYIHVVVLDAGHNAISREVDSGASGFGLYEQDITLDIAKHLRDYLPSSEFKVVMTREGDSVAGNYTTVTGSLQARCDISNNANADLFVSLHVNAGGGTGCEIFVSGLGGNGEKCARSILPYLVQAGQWANRGIKVANDYVIGEHTSASACLIEHGFIDTQSDASKLANPEFRKALALADAKGICDYFGVSTSLIGNKGVVEDTLDVAILKFSANDDWSAQDVDAKLGGVANFTRQGTSRVIPKDAMSAKRLYVIGGATTGHPNEILLSGDTKYDTAEEVGKWLATH